MKKTLLLVMILALGGCSSHGVKQGQSMSELYMKAETAYAQKNYAVAKQHYQTVAERYPDNIGALFKLANISMREKEWDKAMNYYTVILRLKPNHAKAHHNLAMLHLNKANNHLNYYIAHNNTLNNKSIATLLDAINDYSRHKPEKKTSLDRLADIVKQ